MLTAPQGLLRRDVTPCLSTHLHQDKGPLQRDGGMITLPTAQPWGGKAL